MGADNTNISYDQNQLREYRIRHLFWPDALGILSELLLACLAVAFLSLKYLANPETSSLGISNPVNYALLIISETWHAFNQLDFLRYVGTFLFWTLVGMSIYVLLFSLARLVYGIMYATEEGMKYFHHEQSEGIFRLLAKTQYFFAKILLNVLGGLLIAASIFMIFLYANTQIKIGLFSTYPAGIGYLILGFVSAAVGMRFFAAGLCLLLPSFRGWYTT